jgi:hypothetical protein
MKPMNDRTQLGQTRPAGSHAKRERFRIQKLEERIAPARGGNATGKCGGWSCHGHFQSYQ